MKHLRRASGTTRQHPRQRRTAPLRALLGLTLLAAALTVPAVAAPAAAAPSARSAHRAGLPATSTGADFPVGSLIVDMGVSPQTEANGLKPYGLVYELLTTYKIPVAWIVKNGKTTMGESDFTATNVVDLSTNATVASRSFSAGSFIVSGDFAADVPAARLTYWKGQGVKIYRTTTALTGLPQYSQLRSWPRIVLDADSNAVSTKYYDNAGIPSSAYREALPSALTACDDLFVFPHADPTWALHKNLLTFNNSGGYIFGQCHAASVLENIDDPGDADTLPNMNFLSQSTGLVPYGSHSDGTPPYTYTSDWSDPVLQIANPLDAATENGSEQIYLPKTGWRPTTKVLAWDPDHPQLIGGSGTDLSPGKAAVTVYGRGFGNSSNGLVMYQAGHDFSKANAAANVAAQRTFLNFNLLSGIDRSPVATSTVPTAQINSGDTIPVSASATGGSGTYTYKWTSGCGGTFANSTAASTTFTAPTLTAATACTITVTVTDSCGRVSFDAHSVPVSPPPPPAPSVNLSKTVADSNDADSIGSLGETLTYSFSVTNTGNVALTNVTITDAKLGLSNAICVASLAVGATATCPSKTYVVTAADIANGSVHNTATASAKPPTGANVTDDDSATIPTPAVPGIRIDKAVADSNDADSVGALGETLTYTFTVTNTGNVPLTNVNVTDAKLGLSNAACVSSLAVGATATCPAKTYVVTAADVTHGSVDNTATVSATPPSGPPVTGTGQANMPTQANAPMIHLEKTVADSNDADQIGSLGETLTYTFTVTNSGNVPLTNVTITDAKLGLSNSACVSSLAVGATATCPTRTYVVTSADIANGSVHNTATATGSPSTGGTVTDDDDADISSPAAPSMQLDKTVADSNDADHMGSLGETLTYTFTVTNTGNVPLTNVTITDAKLGLSNSACVSSLAVGATVTCPTRTYVVSSTDVANGSVHNTATASGTPPSGPAVTASGEATMPTETAAPGIVLTKSVADSNDAGSIASLGETLTYTFTVRNTGNVALTNVTVTDSKLGLSGSPCVSTLAAGATATCPTATYTVTASDLSHGSVDNTATTSATTPGGSTVTGQASATIPTDQPSLSLTKTVTDTDGDAFASQGEVLTYTFSATNTGNVPLTDLVITDAKVGLSNAACVATLAVGATTTCPLLAPVHYTVTAADMSHGSVSNTATVTGTPPSGPGVSAQDTETIDAVEAEPSGADLSLDKSVDVSHAAPGDVVTYTLTVRNAGAGDALDVVVTDNLPAGTTFVSASLPCTHAGASVTCSFGTVPAGGSSSATIRASVDAVTTSGGDTSHQHQLDYTKIESHISLFGGDTTSATATCPTGYVATDGSVRLDAVDQGTGTFADAVVLASGATADGRGWTGTIHNLATGQVQGKVNVVCATERTTSGENHSHPLVISAPVTATSTFAAGRTDTVLTCAPGSWAIRPSFAFTSGSGVVSTRRTATGWRFTIDAAGPGSATLGVACLATALGTANGHSHDLVFTQLADTVSVPPGEVVERRLTCPDGYKGIVAWADLAHGLVSLGTDPQPITRLYRFYNPTSSALTADFGLLCVAIRTNGGTDASRTVTNTAHVSTSSTDASTADDTDSAAFTVDPATGLRAGPTATVASSAGRTEVRIPVTSTASRAATLRLLAVAKVHGTQLRTGSLLAHSSGRLHAGRHAVHLTVRGPAERALRHGDVRRARLVIVTRDGQREVRIVRLHH